MSAHIQSPYSDSDHTESPLDFPVPQDPEDEDTASPRTELLSASSTRENAVVTVDSRRERRHVSERHRSERERELARITHRRDLVAMLLDEEAESKKLKKALLTAVTRFQAESQKVANLERGNRGATERFRMLNESKVAAELQASQALQELEIYKLQYENAQKEIARAQDAMRMLQQQVTDAEASAARARDKARKLKTQQVVYIAKEEGRRLGFEEGLRNGQNEFRARLVQASQSVPPVLTQTTTSQPYHNANLEQGDSHEQTAEDDAAVSIESSSSESPIEQAAPYVPMEPSQPQPLMQSQPPPMQSEPPSPLQSPQPEPEANLGPPPASLVPGVPMSNKSIAPSVQLYEIDIPPTEVLERQFGGNENYHRQPRNEWVTAVKYSEINGIPPSPSRLPPNAQAGPSNAPSGPLLWPIPPGPLPPAFMPPGSMPSDPVHPISGPSGPILIRPSPSPITPSPIKSAGIRWASIRRPSLRGAKASSWYRSLSFRKKNKPVIDPDPDEEMQEQAAAQPPPPPPPINGDVPDEGRLYRYQPPAPQSWYQGSKLPASLKAPSRRAGSIDSGSTRSTRISNYTILGTPHAGPANRSVQNGVSSGASASGRSTKSVNKRLNQKESLLSVIREDPASRGTTPMSDRFHSGPGRPRAASDTGSMSMGSVMQPNFGALRGQPSQGQIALEVDPSKPPPRHRPTELVFPELLSPQPQATGAGASLHPESARLDPQGSRSQRSPGPTPTTGGTIGISVQPPSQSASPSEARMSVPQSSIYLSPNSTRAPLPQHVNTAPLSFTNTPRNQHGALPPDFGQHLSPRPPSVRLSVSGGRHASLMMNSASLPNAGPSRSSSPHPPSVRSNSYQGNTGTSQPMSRSNTPKIFQAQQLPGSNTPKIFQDVPRAESVRSSASRNNRPIASHMIPSAQPSVLPDTLSDGRNLTRVASNSSLRSMGSYSKFDPSTYVDPALWGPEGVPPAAPSRPASAASGMVPQPSRRHSRALSANSALSYMTEH
ncbi:hypothetical protein BDQ17DRAFT_1420000 [Cyathus striatus]|nr:hypothetical protein BDQ17DRAFT_1420000 [Cyathus striatus]